MRRPELVWGGALGALAVFDYWCAKNATEGDSLSECTRAALRTHTRLGQALFIALWAALDGVARSAHLSFYQGGVTP